MPSGYTAGVADGTISEFGDYARMFARQFGAFVMHRDEPVAAYRSLLALLPETKCSDYHERQLEAAEIRREELLRRTDAEWESHWRSDHKAAVDEWEDRIREHRETRRRYEAMIAKAKLFKSPSVNHGRYAQQLVTHLQESMNRDCGHEPKRPVRPTLVEYREQEVNKAFRDITYHRKGWEADKERHAARVEWVEKLEAAIAAAEADIAGGK